jgi:hypothetical protein
MEKRENEISVELSKSLVDQELCVATDFAGKITKEIVDFKDYAVRESLISLGWIPPTDVFEEVRLEREKRELEFFDTREFREMVKTVIWQANYGESEERKQKRLEMEFPYWSDVTKAAVNAFGVYRNGK